MEDDLTKKLMEDAKNYFTDDYDKAQEQPMLICAKRAINSFKNRKNYPDEYSEGTIKKDFERYYSCIWDIFLFYYVQNGTEFQNSHSENGISRAWKSEEEIYQSYHIIPIGRII